MKKYAIVYCLLFGAFEEDAITADSLWEQNQKDLNEVWLEMTASDQTEPDSLQTITLLGIAYQCPYAGGEAVYQARALLGEGYGYNDAILCDPGQQALIRPANGQLAFSVYPNPAGVFFTVKLDKEASSDGDITLTDMAGRTLLVQLLKERTKEVLLVADQVPTGLYLLTVQIGGEKATQTISIVN